MPMLGGGSELGRRWYADGKGLNKKTLSTTMRLAPNT